MLFTDDLELTRTVIQLGQVCNPSRKAHGRVQSSTIMTAVCKRADCDRRKRGTRYVYKGTYDGTV